MESWMTNAGRKPVKSLISFSLSRSGEKSPRTQLTYVYCLTNRSSTWDLRGQGDKFLRFIQEELKPFIHANYRADPGDSTYMGHSHGGLFGLYTMFHHPDTFQRYVISSPSIHYDNRVTLTYENKYATKHTDLPARVFMSVGAREELDDPLIKPSFQFVTNVRMLVRALRGRNYPGLELTTRIFEGETHASVMPRAFSRGLRVVFG